MKKYIFLSYFLNYIISAIRAHNEKNDPAAPGRFARGGRAAVLSALTALTLFLNAFGAAGETAPAEKKERKVFVASIERVREDSFKLFMDADGPLIISAYVTEAGKSVKNYELFTSSLAGAQESGSVELDLKDAFVRYGIKQKDETGKPSKAYDKKNAEKYDVLLECSPLEYSTSLEFGSAGRLSGLLSGPAGIAVAPDGGIFVCDCGNDRVQKFDASGHFIYEFGSFSWDEKNSSPNNIGVSNAASFNEPVSIAVSSKNIFVSERGNNRIQKFDRDANFILAFGGEGKALGRLNSPLGIACDRSNYVWVCDCRNDRVQKFDANGNYMLELGGFGYASGKFNEPVDIAIDSRNNICVLDAGNKRIVRFDEYGNVLGEISLKKIAGLKSASTLAILLDGIVLAGVTLDSGARVAAFDTGGAFLGFFGGKFLKISGLAADRNANVFVSDGAANKITRLSCPAEKIRVRVNMKTLTEK